MNSIDIILLNFSETRRRSLIIWKSVPEEYLNWQPDDKALTIIAMIRHVLEAEHLFHVIINNRGNLGDYQSPWQGLEYSDVEYELKLAESHGENLIKMIKTLSEADLEEVMIKRAEVGQIKKLGDYLNRMVYHEAVHAGQLLDYLRTIRIPRPQIWD